MAKAADAGAYVVGVDFGEKKGLGNDLFVRFPALVLSQD